MDTRERIKAEARELFLQGGLAGFSMRALAERVGVSATALYRHFDDKDALLASLLSEAFGTFGAYLGRALAGRTPLERFRGMGLAYVEFALDHPRDYELMFVTDCAEAGYKRIRGEIGERSRPTFEMLVDRVKECMQHGIFAPRDERQVALYVWATLHGIVSLWLFGQIKDSFDERALRQHVELTIDLIEISLRPQKASKRR